MFAKNVQFAPGGRNNRRRPRRSVREASDDRGFNGSGWPDFTWENGDISALPGRPCFPTHTFDHRCIRRRCPQSLPLPRHRSHKYVNRIGRHFYRYAVSIYDGPGQGSMLRDQKPELSRSGKSAAQDPHRDARSHGSGALLRVEGQFCECAWLQRLSLEKLFMHEYRHSKEQALARTLHKTLRLMKKCLLLGLMAAISLDAQNSAPSVTTWAGGVRTVAGEPVAKAKVTLFIPTAKKKQLIAVTGADGKFAIARITPGPHSVSVQLPGRGPTAPVAVDITDMTIVLTVSGQNVLSTAANPHVPPAEVSIASSSGTTNTA